MENVWTFLQPLQEILVGAEARLLVVGHLSWAILRLAVIFECESRAESFAKFYQYCTTRAKPQYSEPKKNRNLIKVLTLVRV